MPRVDGDDVAGDLSPEPNGPPERLEPAAVCYYRSLGEFAGWLLQVYRRSTRGQARVFCPQWWKHPEAVARMDALWRAFEQLRQDPGTGMSVFWRDHADHHMTVLLDADGPFKGCEDGPLRPTPSTRSTSTSRPRCCSSATRRALPHAGASARTATAAAAQPGGRAQRPHNSPQALEARRSERMAGEHHEPDGIAEAIEELLRTGLLLGTRWPNARLRAREQALRDAARAASSTRAPSSDTSTPPDDRRSRSSRACSAAPGGTTRRPRTSAAPGRPRAPTSTRTPARARGVWTIADELRARHGLDAFEIDPAALGTRDRARTPHAAHPRGTGPLRPPSGPAARPTRHRQAAVCRRPAGEDL